MSAHQVFQISKIKSLIEDPASRNNVVSFKRKHLCFVLVTKALKIKNIIKKKFQNSKEPGKISVAII